MVPDTPDQGVLMYKAVDFPFRWQRAHTLLAGGRFSDSSIFEYRGGMVDADRVVARAIEPEIAATLLRG